MPDLAFDLKLGVVAGTVSAEPDFLAFEKARLLLVQALVVGIEIQAASEGGHTPQCNISTGRCNAVLFSVNICSQVVDSEQLLTLVGVKAHRQVDGLHMLGKCANGNIIDTSRGDRGQPLAVDVAGGFQLCAAIGD